MKKPLDDVGGLCFSKVVVVGANGAGKTWFSTRLAHQMGAPVVCNDALALTTHWRKRGKSDVISALEDQSAGSRWGIEGGPTVLTPTVIIRADLVVWLDIPAPVRFWRVICRSVRYMGRNRPEHPFGNRDWPGFRQIRFAWRSLTTGAEFKRRISAALTGTDVDVVRLSQRSDVLGFLAIQAAR